MVRYFEFALTPGQPLLRTARIEHEGEFRGALDYLQGVGSMQGKLAALIPVVNARGGAELATGSLHRYLAESVWLLPSPVRNRSLMSV